MASTTFPLAQSGSLAITDASVVGFCIDDAFHTNDQKLFPVTGSCLVGGSFVQDKSPRYVHGIPTQEFILRGHIERSNLYALSQESTIALGDEFQVRIAEWNLRKVWPLVNVTGSGSGTEEEWVWGIPIYTFRCRGWAIQPIGPGTATQEENITFTADEIGTIAWTDIDANPLTDSGLKVRRVSTQVPLGIGGGIPVSISGNMHGDIAYTPGLNDLSWIFIDPTPGPDDPVKSVVTLDTDAEVVSSSTLFYYFDFTWNGASGGPVNIEIRCRFDKA